MTNKEVSDFQRYLDLRKNVRDINFLVWESLNDKIIELMKISEDVTPQIHEDVKKAYDDLSLGIIPTIFPTDFPNSKNFRELQLYETQLLRDIPHALKDMFLKLFKGFLRNSTNNRHAPGDTLFNLLEKFNFENVEIRYAGALSNPYLQNNRHSSGDWRKIAKDELYEYYGGVIDLLKNIRNFQTHKEEPFFSDTFDLAKRKISEPISEIEHPGNYIILTNLVVFSVYEFIEILQVWIDTQSRIGRI